MNLHDIVITELPIITTAVLGVVGWAARRVARCMERQSDEVRKLRMSVLRLRVQTSRLRERLDSIADKVDNLTEHHD